MFSKLSLLSNPLQKLKTSLKQSINEIINPEPILVTQIIPNKLYHISPPAQSSIEPLLQHFQKAHQFQLWNIGQYSYSEQILTKLLKQGKRNSDGRQVVYNLTYDYFANIPFCEMIKAIENMQTFLSLNPGNKVFLHCQANKRRSAVFLASYIFLTGFQTDIVKSILTVNKLLQISIQDKQISSPSSIYKSQHLILKNLMNYTTNSSFINKTAWELKKVLINNAPKIHLVLKLNTMPKEQLVFKVLLEIRSVEGIIYKKIFQDQFIEGESLCLRIPEGEVVLLKDDFVVIIKYVYDKKGYSILRAQLNTNFIYDQYFRVQRSDMDLSINNAHTQNQTIFMDLMLQANEKEISQLSKLNILKDSSQKQTSSPVHAQKNEVPLKSVQKSDPTQQKDQDEEDGFRILDEEQQAEHNQKMQRQIEEQLARELQNIRKRKNQQIKKTNQQKQEFSANQNEQSLKQNLKDEKTDQKSSPKKYLLSKTSEDIKENENVSFSTMTQSQQEKNQQNQEKSSQKNLQKTELIQQKENKQIVSQQKQKEPSSDGSGSQDSSEQSQSSEEEEQQEDLQDYLSKLQKQAEKH